MLPIENKFTNANYVAPRGWNEAIHGPCYNLPVHHDNDGHMYTWWKPSWKEWVLLLIGVPVRLCIKTQVVHPMSLEVTDK